MTDMNQPPEQPPAPPPKTKKAKPPSRSTRWSDAVGKARSAIDVILGSIDDLEAAMGEIKSVQEEYEEWKDNMPENLSSSPLGEKLEEVCSLDLESAADSLRSAADDAEGTIGEAENMELPQGFGRD